MITTTTPAHGCYLPAPLDGGPLQHAPAKVGAWAWEPKVDDWRAKIHVPTRTVWNQYGKLSTPAQQGKLDTALDRLVGMEWAVEWLDCGIMENRHDMMRGSIIVFDMIDQQGGPNSSGPWNYRTRRAHLECLFDVLPLATDLLARGQCRDSLFLINNWIDVPDPMVLYSLLREENMKLGAKFYEGLVAKRLDATYPANFQSAKTKTPSWIKHRFDQGL